MKQIKVKTIVTNNNFLTPDGEVVSQSTDIKHVKRIVDEDTFYFVFAAIEGLFDDLNYSEIKVVSYAAQRAQMDTNMFHFNKIVAEDMFVRLKLSYQTVVNALGNLKKENILINVTRGAYRINPRYYWRGKLRERSKVMSYVLEMECPQC